MRLSPAWLAAGAAAAVVAVGAIVWMSRTPPAAARPPVSSRVSTRAPRHPSRPRSHSPASRPSPPATVAASFAAAAKQPASTPLETVTLPWAPATTWAIDPVAVQTPGFPPTLWFGMRTGAGPWTWIPSHLPGALSRAYPVPVYQALAEAYDLHAGQPGPANLGGTISWQALAGHVSKPRGWTLQRLPADASPLVAPTVEITVWMQSDTGLYTGYYGLETVWDAANASSGAQDILGFQAASAIPSSAP